MAAPAEVQQKQQRMQLVLAQQRGQLQREQPRLGQQRRPYHRLAMRALPRRAQRQLLSLLRLLPLWKVQPMRQQQQGLTLPRQQCQRQHRQQRRPLRPALWRSGGHSGSGWAAAGWAGVVDGQMPPALSEIALTHHLFQSDIQFDSTCP